MQMTAQDVAWMKGQASYEKGDAPGQAGIKALQNGYLPGSENYAAFVRGFLELVEPAI